MYLGIDIGATTTKCGLYHENKQIHKEIINSKQPNLIDVIINYIINMEEQYNIKAVGIGVPGFVNDKGYIFNLPNLHIKNIDLKKKLSQSIKSKFIIKNDADMAGYFISQSYDTKNKNIFVITLGSGVGGSFIYNGNLLSSNHGKLTEIGHLPIDNKYNFICNCKQQGCLETIISINGTNNLLKYYQDKFPDSPLYKQSNPTVKDVYDMAKDNDFLALKIVNIQVYYISQAIHIINTILDLDLVIITGGIANAKDILLNKIKKEYLCQSNNKLLEIVISQQNKDAGMAGAALLAQNTYERDERNEINRSRR